MTEPDYQAELKTAKRAGRDLRAGWGFRRNQISLEELDHRMVDHCTQAENLCDWSTTGIVLQILNNALRTLVGDKDEEEVTRLQQHFSHSGAENLADQLPGSRLACLSHRWAIILISLRKKKVPAADRRSFRASHHRLPSPLPGRFR